MADAGFVEYDQDCGQIATTSHTQAAEAVAVFAGKGLGMVFMLTAEGLGPVRTLVLTVLVALVALSVVSLRSRFDDGHPPHSPASR